ncbi:glycosyltransferase family 4 protein [Ancylobacter sp. FA202]|uniref:glycosyltransferase family 4 protein n=1 Tax=Ancylobacter sp. FA202 TaxID=1111106 RepID=UPI00036124B0|nr:glycosyltransferase family 4 protein [Ancylobacter sp. FA202]
MTLDSSAQPVRPRLLYVAQWFDPEPTANKGSVFAERLHALGFEVEVVTGFPNYPSGKVYEGYKIRPINRRQIGNVLLTRLALYPSHDSSRIGRSLNYLSFFASALVYLTFFARRTDVILAYHPPIMVGVTAAVAGFFRRIPVVVDVQDMWPDTLRATGMVNSERLIALIGRVCRWTWRRMDRIIAQSEGFRRLLIERGVAPDRIRVIHNWGDHIETGGVAPAPPAALAAPGRFRVLFAGNLGRAQGLDTVLDAAALLAESHPQIEFCILGDGLETERLKLAAAARGLGNVRFFPRVSKAEVGPWLAAADVLLVHLKDDPLFAITVPSKTQAYLATGRPILMAVAGDGADMLRAADAGLAIPPEDSAALAAAVQQLAALDPAERERMGARGRAFYERELSFEKGTQAFADVVKAAIAERRKTG